MSHEKTYHGLVIRSHNVRDAESKDKAQATMSGWQPVEQTAAQWILDLEQGHTIQPSQFTPKEDGKYTHAKEYWQGTHFVCADADYIRGVEFADKLLFDSDGKQLKDDEGKPIPVLDDNGVPVKEDVNPGGVESWTEQKHLSVLYPTLKDECYACVQSVTSMSDSEKYVHPHRRYRLIFLFDEKIVDISHYKQVLSALIEKYPIISPPKRGPTQPVFGNARKETGKPYITGNVLSLSDYPYVEPEPKAQSAPETEHSPPSVSEASATLQQLPNNVDYHRWIEIGMACKSAGLPMSVWDDWSKTAAKYQPGECEKKWASFNSSGVSWGSVVHWANPNPKKDKDSGSSPVDAEIPKTMNGLDVVMLSEENGVVMAKPRHLVSDDVATYLWKNESIYRRGIFLGTLRRGEDAPVFVRSETHSIGGDISRSCALMRHSKIGVPSTVANAPGWLCADILHNQPVDKVREVRVVVSHPFYNGEKLVTAEGYDSRTQTYLDSSHEVEMGEHTPETDLKLWYDLLGDFPFEDDSDKENAIGFALTLIVRQGLKVGEEVPLFYVTAAREGVGKSLLACTLCSAVMGYNMATDDLSSDRAEIEKAVGGILLSAREAVVFDNVDTDKPLDSGLLASIVTQPKRSMRPLGTSQMALIENCATFCCTGSNVEVKPEIAKRMVSVRLSDPGIPEKDRVVKIEGLQDYVLEHREKYLSALVRMVQRWIDAGKKESTNTHRMRQWSRVVRGIMLANGFGGNFLGNADAVMLSASPEFATWTSAFKEIVVFLQEKAFEGWTAKDVFVVLSFEKEVYAHELDKGVNDGKSFTRMAQGRGILDELIGNQSNDQARRVRVGQLLRSKMGAVYGKLKLIDTHKHRGGVKLYALQSTGDDDESDDEGGAPF